MDLSDEELLLTTRLGDAATFPELARRHADFLFCWFIRMTNDCPALSAAPRRGHSCVRDRGMAKMKVAQILEPSYRTLHDEMPNRL